ncbi:DNA polymerase III subunit beta [Proteinivorax hydrogeniformans]|uniref:Beta sliding clamp n=1 Tax=Proteinivorax hydrogeniformans TaxID=1826727 RepID=A0AAU8HTF0_9FIRM
MEFYCSQEELLAGISITQRGISSKTTIQVLSGIMLKVSNNHLYLKSTDLEITIEYKVPVKTVTEGEIILPAKILTDIVRKMPKEEIHFSMTEDKNVKIKSSTIEIDLTGESTEEFPKFPQLPEGKILGLSELKLKNMLKQTAFAISTEESRPVLTGVLFEIKGSTLNLIATDGHRLAYKVAVLEDEPKTPLKVIVPRKAITELQRILVDDEDNTIDIYVKDSIVFFVFENVIFSSRVIEGKFPPYQQIIPSDNNTKLKVNTKILQTSIERAELLSREGARSLVKFKISDILYLTSNTPDLGSLSEQLPVDKEGEDLEIAFNAKLITDCLKNIDVPEVYLEFNGSFNPCLIKPVIGDDYLHLVLPIRTA